MSSSIKPIKLWGKSGPNPPKVAMVLTELGLPHEIIPIPFPDLKKPEFLAINPNGRMPAIEDPNTNLTLWESGAIIEYLIEKYDKDNKISFEPGSNNAQLARQWLYFQVSGQGPYYGQASWFKKFHHEDLPSAKERYNTEVQRVSSVLEDHLQKEKEKSGGNGDGPWLVGNKFSYADLSFLSWQIIVNMVVGPESYDPEKFPEVSGWVDRMLKRSVIKKVVDEQIFVHRG